MLLIGIYYAVNLYRYAKSTIEKNNKWDLLMNIEYKICSIKVEKNSIKRGQGYILKRSENEI